MSAGFKYNLNAPDVVEELYDVQTGHRKRGAYKLDCTGLTNGSILPNLTPVSVDLKTRLCKVVKNVKVLEEVAADATTAKIAKNSLVEVNMILGTGTKGAKVTAIDKSNADFDLITLEAAFGEKVLVGAVLFEATAAGGTKPKNVANFLIYGHTKVEAGIVLIALLMQAYEIQEDKLTLPVSAKDKEALTCRFQFE